MSSEVTWRVYFVRTVSPVPKYTLLVASELITLFFKSLRSKGALGIHRFATLAHNDQKVLKKGVTPPNKSNTLIKATLRIRAYASKKKSD